VTALQIKATILAAGAPKPAFADISVSGRRANAQAAVAMAAAHAVPADSDHDGVPDTLDNSDADGDGVPDSSDACINEPAATANGCPAQTTTPPTTDPGTPTPAPPAPDSDADGRPDASDLCPTEAAGTTTGCPIPGLKKISVRVPDGKRQATIKVRTTRAASAALKVERSVCNKRGRKCRWRKAASIVRSTRHNAVTFTLRRLAPGRYRVSVRLSSPAGRARLVHSGFRI
jgi:hypothetical protein